MAELEPGNDLPLIAITMGDPAGVGPEVTLRALAEGELHLFCRPVVIGDGGVLVKAIEMLGKALVVRPIVKPADARFSPRIVNVFDLGNVDWRQLEVGQISAAAGRASVEYVIKGIELARAGEVDAIVTGPINKKSVKMGGYDYIGHTEILNDLTHASRTTTMLVARDLRVTHVTRHVPFGEVARHLTRDRILQAIYVTAAGLQQLGIDSPCLGVAALNPHGGEGGLLGREELEAIAPAVEEARQRGIDARGPYPADSIFFRAIAGEFDAVVAMYHDQGHIPVKVHDFEGSYSVTLGLPIVRTSVDHGTGFDIAWQGVASPRSMIEAVKAAVLLARRRAQ